MSLPSLSGVSIPPSIVPQRDDRVDAERAPYRSQAAERCGEAERCAGNHVGRRIRRRGTDELRLRYPRELERKGKPEPQPDSDREQTYLRDEPENVVGARAHPAVD